MNLHKILVKLFIKAWRDRTFTHFTRLKRRYDKVDNRLIKSG